MKHLLNRIIPGFLACICVVSFSSQTVKAVSRGDLDAIINNTPFYSADDEKCDVDVSGPAGSGPLDGPFFPKIGDTADLKKRMTEYVQKTKPSSPLLSHIGEFVDFGKQYNVNPVMVLAMAQKETSLGTAGFGKPGIHNILNVQHGGSTRFAPYPSYTVAIEEFMKLMASKTYLGPPSNFTTVSQIIHRTTPKGDGANDPDNFTTFVISVIHKVLDGSSTDAPAAAASTPQVDSKCGQTTNAGEYGWDLTGPHAMVSYEQIDKQWSGLPYGAGKDSIGASGCGPTSLAMIGSTLLGDKSITPVALANKYGAKYHSNGTDWSLMPVFARDYNLKYQDLGTSFDGAITILKAGGLVLISVDPGWFTPQGHFMVVRAVSPDGQTFFLNDPNGAGYHKDSETRGFTRDFFVSQGHMLKMWGYSK